MCQVAELCLLFLRMQLQLVDEGVMSSLDSFSRMTVDNSDDVLLMHELPADDSNVPEVIGRSIEEPAQEYDGSPEEVPADPERVLRAVIVAVSDHPEDGDSPSGALVTELLVEAGFHVDALVHVPCSMEAVRQALQTCIIGGVDLVLTTGGIGLTPRDIVPEATEALIDRQLHGIEESLRMAGLALGELDAAISRGVAGISGQTLIANIPESRTAIRAMMAPFVGIARHIIGELSGMED